METLAFCGAGIMFLLSEFDGFVINKVFEYLNNAVGIISAFYTI